MKLTVKSVHPFCPDFREIHCLLKSAFPKEEQTSMLLLLLGSLRKHTHFLRFYDADDFVGLLYVIENDQYAFILYLAVNPEIRSKGIGGQILEYARAQARKKNVVLNVESLDPSAVNYAQRKQRIAFYAKHGISETGYTFSADKVNYAVLASSVETFNPEEYAKFLGGLRLEASK